MNQKEVRDLKNVVSLLYGFENIRAANPMHAPFPSSVYETLGLLIEKYETKGPKLPKPAREVSFVAGAKGGEGASPSMVRLTLARPEAEVLCDRLEGEPPPLMAVYEQLVLKVRRG